MYEDKTLVCKECGAEFVFSAGEQEFYAERGFQNEPQRCKACRGARKKCSARPPGILYGYLRGMWRRSARPLRAEDGPCCLLQRMLCKDEGTGLIHEFKKGCRALRQPFFFAVA